MIYWFTSNGFRWRVVERDTGRATRIRRGEGSSLSSVSRFCSLVVVAWSRRETASRARRTPHAVASRSLDTTRVPRIGGHDETGRGSTRARDATRGSTTADEPRTHLILRELVQLVHLPLVVIPHGPGRARARTASRGRGSFCQVPEFRAAKAERRVFASARLPFWRSTFRFCETTRWCASTSILRHQTKSPYTWLLPDLLWCTLSLSLPPSFGSPQRVDAAPRRTGRHGHGQSKRHGVDSRPRRRRRG